MLLMLFLNGAAALFSLVASAEAGAFVDAVGRRVMLPDHIDRIMPAERDAEVLLFVLAPEKLAGMEATSPAARLPRGSGGAVLGWRPRSSPESMAAVAQRLRAELIIDASPASPGSVVFADQVQQLSGIPYIVLDDSYARTPRAFRVIGALLGLNERADDLALFAEHAISELRGRLLIRSATARPRIYYGLGSDGLTTPLPGAPAAATLEAAGTINVTAPLGRGTEVTIRPSELLNWDPDVIIAQRRSFYDSLHRDQRWRRLSAVRNKRVYLEPNYLFGWIDNPSGVNRLIGLYWLSALLYPEVTYEDLRSAAWRSVVCGFYDKFYRVRLTNSQLEAMIRTAGAPPLTSGQPDENRRAGPVAGLPSVSPAISAGLTTARVAVDGAANEKCSIPTGPVPKPLPGITVPPGAGQMDSPSAAPGVPPAGQRGRPATGLPGPNPLGPLPR
jgi:iron complex transport system substrate-binding protein